MLNDKDENIYRSVVHPVPLINEYSLFFVAGTATTSLVSRSSQPTSALALVPRLSPVLLSSMRQKAGEEPGNEANHTCML